MNNNYNGNNYNGNDYCSNYPYDDSYYYQNNNKNNHQSPTFLSRSLSFIIDLVIFVLLSLLVGLVQSLFIIFNGFSYINALPFLIFLVFILYNTFIYKFIDEQSIGKKIMGIKLVSNKGNLSVFKLFIRSFLIYLGVRFFIILFIDLLVLIIKKKSLHDIILNTNVIKY